MDIMVFQHLKDEDPGSLKAKAAAADARLHIIRLDAGETIPKLDSFDALWVLGGSQDVWEVREYPWLIDEKRAIRDWVKRVGKPYLGICLGHQLLADALNGTCGPQKPAEVGVRRITLTDAGRADPFLRNIPPAFNALQWHGVQVAQPPEGSEVLATSPNCPVEAMRLDEIFWSTQFHFEVMPGTVEKWSAIPAYHADLVEALGTDGLETFRQETNANMEAFLQNSSTLFDNFLRAMR